MSDADTTFPDPATGRAELTKALVAAAAELPRVEYTKPVKGQSGGLNYEFLSEEDIVLAVRGVLSKHGLAFYPVRMEVVHNGEYMTSADRPRRMSSYLILVTYRLAHCSGQSDTIQALGEGSDVGDKGMNKAMTAAYKYALREMLFIAGGTDPDKTASSQIARGGGPADGPDDQAAVAAFDRYKAKVSQAAAPDEVIALVDKATGYFQGELYKQARYVGSERLTALIAKVLHDAGPETVDRAAQSVHGVWNKYLSSVDKDRIKGFLAQAAERNRAAAEAADGDPESQPTEMVF